ncbi:hypothetical protein H1R20_g5547, partial [Candolleomyces eurysporus]
MLDAGSRTPTFNLVDHDELNIAMALMANQLAYQSSQVDSSEELTSIALSPDGEYLATATISGTVSIRSVRDSGRKVQSLNAGTSVKVSALLWGPVTQTGRPLFIASSNGFINCVTYRGTNFTENPPTLTSGFVPALVTSMALNPSSSILAVAYDYTVRLLDLPLPGTDATTARVYVGRLVWMELTENGRSIQSLPVRSHPWPIKLEWLSDTVICIGLFSKIVAVDISTAIPKTSWTIEAPHASQLGSFAISPSKKLIAATNLRSGVDWFDVNSSQFISTTAVEDDYLESNYMLPIFFLGEKSFVCGHNTGSAIIGGNGLDGVRQIASGNPVRYPSQLLLKIVIILLASVVSISVLTWRESLVLHPFAGDLSQNLLLQLLKSAAVPWKIWGDEPRTTALALESGLPDEVVFSYFRPLPIETESAIVKAIEEMDDIETSKEGAPLPEDTAPVDTSVEDDLEDDDIEFEEETLEYLQDDPEKLVNPTVTILETKFITMTETVVSTITLRRKPRRATSAKERSKPSRH